MAHNLYKTSNWTAQNTPGSNFSTLPLKKLQRREISFLQCSLKVPVYPDQTNTGQENTRAQIRYSIFPIIEDLGFEYFEQQLEKLIKLHERKQRSVAGDNLTIHRPNDGRLVQTIVMTVAGYITFELPGTRTQNCPVKSRELYH